MHYIQKYILDKLVFAERLRNRDMRPPHTESNLFQYHLKRLVDSGYIQHVNEEYTLSGKGLQYADRHSSDLKEQRPQPKLVTILRLENESGEVLLVPRKKQPFIGMYNLPSGKIHEGETLLSAGYRELSEKVGVGGHIKLVPDGTAHLTIVDGEVIISESYGFILKAIIGDNCTNEGIFMRTDGITNSVMPGIAPLIRHKGNNLELTVDQNTNSWLNVY